MPAIVWNLLILIFLAYAAWLGSAHGLYRSGLIAAEAFFCLGLAVLLHEPIAGFLSTVAFDNLSFFLPESLSYSAWAVFLVFGFLMWGTFLVLWVFYHPKVVPEGIATIPAVDTGGGGVMGVVAGILLLGAAMVTWSMCPFLWGVRIPAQDLLIDPGREALKAGAAFSMDVHEGRSLVLFGEPPSRESDSSALLCSETFATAEGGSKPGEFDPYFDADENGSFTENLYFVNVDGDRSRRIGLIEKYTVARWDLSAMSNVRERPKRESPAPAVAAGGPTPAKPGPEKPAPEKPGPEPPAKPAAAAEKPSDKPKDKPAGKPAEKPAKPDGESSGDKPKPPKKPSSLEDEIFNQ